MSTRMILALSTMVLAGCTQAPASRADSACLFDAGTADAGPVLVDSGADNVDAAECDGQIILAPVTMQDGLGIRWCEGFPASLRMIRIHVFRDGAEVASVEVPCGPLSAAGTARFPPGDYELAVEHPSGYVAGASLIRPASHCDPYGAFDLGACPPLRVHIGRCDTRGVFVGAPLYCDFDDPAAACNVVG